MDSGFIKKLEYFLVYVSIFIKLYRKRPNPVINGIMTRVDRILLVARVPIHGLKLSTYAVEPVEVIRWICEGVRLNAAEMELKTDRDFRDPYLPQIHCVFSKSICMLLLMFHCLKIISLHSKMLEHLHSFHS